MRLRRNGTKGTRPVANRPVASTDAPDDRWRARPWAGRIIRFSVLAIPLIISFLFALAATHAIEVPDSTAWRIARWIGIAIASTLVLLGMQRVARRFIPLGGLLSLTLIFPDTAPSRFGTALRRGTPKQLQAKLDQVGEDGLGDTPREAAEQLLDLVTQLSIHDRMTRGHSERVRAYSHIIGEEMGLDETELDRLHWAGMLHDVGKMYVPSEILNKPGRLTDEEFETIKTHTTHGKRLVAGLAPWLGESARAVWEHHERWEGGGYPSGVTGDQTALASRIVSVADAFDVMTSARSYKKPMSATLARSELERCAGGQFDPTVVRAMMSVSLGQLWAAMGPLSLIAQIRLFPRNVTRASSQAAAAAAALLALIATTVIAGAPWSEGPDQTSIAAPPPIGTPNAVDAEPEPPPTAAASASTSTSTSTTTSTSTSTTTTTTTTTTTVPEPPPVTTARPSAAPPITTRPTTPVTRPTAPRTTPATTRATTPATVATTAPATTAATTTTTTVPVAPGRLTLSSGAIGSTASTAILPLGVDAPANGLPLPNYDTDRNTDPGLTLVRSEAGIDGTDNAARQVWAIPSGSTQLRAPIQLQLWFAPAALADVGLMVVEAGLFDCATTGPACVEIARGVAVLQPTPDRFSGVAFNLTPAAGDHIIAPNRRAEIRVAVPGGSTDAIVAFDSIEYPATITFGT